jgi:hypothetical protein
MPVNRRQGAVDLLFAWRIGRTAFTCRIYEPVQQKIGDARLCRAECQHHSQYIRRGGLTYGHWLVWLGFRGEVRGGQPPFAALQESVHGRLFRRRGRRLFVFDNLFGVPLLGHLYR